MHELALMRSVLEAVLERVGSSKVVRIRLEIGRLTAVLPEAMQLSFQACTRGTPLEGATLEIDQIPGRGRCRRCAAELELEDWSTRCPCGGADLELLSGRELRVRDAEVIACV